MTLPADSLTQAERIARTRKINLSTVIAEALTEGLRMHSTAERSEQILDTYRKAFLGFSPQEMLALDGIIVEDRRKR